MANKSLKIFERVCIGIAVLCLFYAIYRVWIVEDVRGPFAQERYYKLGDVRPNGYLRTEFAEKIKSDLSHEELIADLNRLKSVNEDLKEDLEKKLKTNLPAAEVERVTADLQTLSASQAELQSIIDELLLDIAPEAASATGVTSATEIVPPSFPTLPAPVGEQVTDGSPSLVAPPPLPATH